MASKSPFKLLDAYRKQDKDIFFGREEEVEALYEMTYQTNFILVYGPSGSGKTSLVQCGLANRFQSSDWFDIYIRRGEDINTSLQKALDAYDLSEVESGTLIERLSEIKTRREEDHAVAVLAPAGPAAKSLRAIYEYHLKPVYLIFDQFEELYVLGNEKEQKAFYKNILNILQTEEYCRIIIVLREEYLAQLDAFEKVIPYLFEKRLRVEPMTRHNTNEVIVGTTGKFGIRLKDETTSDLIVDALAKGQKRVELTYLQVFLDKLFQMASKTDSKQVVFDNKDVRKLGNIENILGEFLDDQARIIQERLQQQYHGAPPDAVRNVLSAFVTLEGTKQPLRKEAVKAVGLSQPQVEFCIAQLENARLLRLEGGLYELAHDALAQQIARQRSVEEVAVLEITKIVKDRYSVFERSKAYLTRNELHLLGGYREKIQAEGRLSPQEWVFVEKSRREVQKQRRLKIGLVMLAMAVLAVFSIYSQALRIKAEEALERLKIEEANTREARYKEFYAKAKQSFGESRYTDAVKELETALAFDSTRQEALDLKEEAAKRLLLEEEFNRLIAAGDQLFSRGESFYLEALDKYNKALELNFNNLMAERKRNQVIDQLGSAFEKFKTAGDAFFEAKGYSYALNAYRQAARIRPYDAYIKGRIQECLRIGSGN